MSGASVYNYYRDYSPEIGRYIESDPIGLRGGINTYAYVEANPLAEFDQEGRASSAIQPVPIIPPTSSSITGGKGSILAPIIGAGIALAVGYAICQIGIEQCKQNCHDAYDLQVKMCRDLKTKTARRQCYENAAKLYGECLANCD